MSDHNNHGLNDMTPDIPNEMTPEEKAERIEALETTAGADLQRELDTLEKQNEELQTALKGLMRHFKYVKRHHSFNDGEIVEEFEFRQLSGVYIFDRESELGRTLFAAQEALKGEWGEMYLGYDPDDEDEFDYCEDWWDEYEDDYDTCQCEYCNCGNIVRDFLVCDDCYNGIHQG